jgi:hypothetical protein
MAGQIRNLIDAVVEQRTKGSPSLQHFVRAQLLLRGINPDHYTRDSDDNPAVIAKLQQMVREFSQGKETP